MVRQKPEYNKENCNKCPLLNRPYVPNKTIGNKILFVAEVPGASEEVTGEPLVGKAGKIFRDIVNFVGIPWNDVSIGNTVCCRTTTKEGGVRPPTKDEIGLCYPIIEHTIKELKPEFIVTLGDTATSTILNNKRLKITDIEGTLQESKFGKVIPLLHPSYLNYKPYETQRYKGSFQRMKELVYGDAPKIENEYKVDGGNLEARTWFFDSLNNGAITFDVETTGVELFTKEVDLLSIGFGTQDQKCIVVDWVKNSQVESYKKLLENPNIPKVLFNAKFDCNALKKIANINVKGRLHDVMLAHYLDSGMVGGKIVSNKLKNIAKAYGVSINQIKEVDPAKIGEIPKEELYEYNKSDVVLTTYLHNKIPKREPAYSLLCNAIPMLSDVESRGLLIDSGHLENTLLPKYKRLYDDTHNNIIAFVKDEKFNPASPKQVAGFLRKDGVKLSKTPKNNYSVRSDIISNIDHPLCKLLTGFKKTQKLLSTYIEPYLGMDRIHTNYNLHFTETGRVSSGKPFNVQNIPRDPEFRKLFIAPEGHDFVSIDFQQIEPKVLALLAGDKELLNTSDVYTFIFKRMYRGLPTKEERQALKPRVLGVMYGLMDEEVIRTFFPAFPKVARWIASVRNKALRTKRIDVPYTNRWRDLNREEDSDRVKRLAVNTIIQSLASDITINAGIQVYRAGFNGVYICNTVHDEIDFYVRKDLIKKDIIKDIVNIIKESPSQIIPEMKNVLNVDVEIGKDWSFT
ncbi:MAG: DNA polymerase [bacterium]